MNMTKEVETSIGKFTLQKPKAGKRNKALIKAELANGEISITKLMINLLPKCIIKRPDGVDDTVPIEHIVDDLEDYDYDKLAEALGTMLNLGSTEKEDNDRKKQ